MNNNIHITLQRIIMGVCLTLMMILNYNTAYALTANIMLILGLVKNSLMIMLQDILMKIHIMLSIVFGRKLINTEFMIKQLYLPYLKQNLVGELNLRVMVLDMV